jgi:hypothetical protein
MVVIISFGAVSLLWKQLHASVEKEHVLSWKGLPEMRRAD